MKSSPLVVVVYKGRHGADLHCVRVIGWIFKQAVVRVEQLSGHQEEELSGGTTVVQSAKQESEHMYSKYTSVGEVKQCKFFSNCGAVTQTNERNSVQSMYKILLWTKIVKAESGQLVFVSAKIHPHNHLLLGICNNKRIQDYTMTAKHILSLIPPPIKSQYICIKSLFFPPTCTSC